MNLWWGMPLTEVKDAARRPIVHSKAIAVENSPTPNVSSLRAAESDTTEGLSPHTTQKGA